MKCDCGKKPVIFRKYEGAHLCEQHFIDSIERKAKKTISKYFPIESGDRIVVAISGGKDSAVALSIVHGIVKDRRDVSIFAVSIDEGIEGYRDKSLESAKKMCESLGIEHRVYSYKEFLGKTLDKKIDELKMVDPKKVPSCTFCGVGRRWSMNKAAKDLKATKIVTGHNLDDEVQSIMMDYLRGDLAKLSRMDPKLEAKKGFVKRVKPLREIPEKEVALYAILKGFPVCFDECPYVSGLRFEVRDFLNKMEDEFPGTKFSIIKTFDRISESLKSVLISGELKPCEKCGEPTSGDICKTCELWGNGNLK